MTTNTSGPSHGTGNRLLRRRAPIVWIDAGLRLVTLSILLLVGWANAAAEQEPVRAPSARIALHLLASHEKTETSAARGAH